MPCYHCAGCWWCNGVGDVFLAHFRPLSANSAMAYLSIFSYHVHPFMATMYYPLMATSSRIMHYVTKLDSFQIGFLNMTMSSLY